jgi:hypothetical protein
VVVVEAVGAVVLYNVELSWSEYNHIPGASMPQLFSFDIAKMYVYMH